MNTQVDSYLSALKTRAQESWKAQKDLLETVEGTPSAEQREQLERMDADLDTILAEEKRYRDRLDIVEASDAFRADLAPRVETARASRKDPTDRDLIAQMVKGEIRGFESNFSAGNGHEYRALQTEGGSAVPTTFADLVSVYARTVDPTLEVATVLNTPNGNPLVIPRLTADAAGGGTVTAENAQITLADATISNLTLNAFRYASIQPVSFQLWRDNVIGLEDLLARTGGRQIGIAAGSAYAFANGSAGPNGYVAGGSAGATASGTASGNAFDTFFSPADLVDLFHSVVVPWRAVGVWMVSNTALAKIRKFRDSDGMFQYDPGIAQQPQPTLLGRPIYENPSMAAVASASKSVIFGDFTEYYIRRLPLRVDVSTEAYWTSDGVAVRIVLETDGDIAHPTAIRPLVSANT